MMSSLLVSGAVRASVVLLLALVACVVMRRASAAARRSLLAAALGTALLVPAAAAVVPAWKVETPAALRELAHESPLEGLTPPDAASEVTVLAASQGGASRPSVVAVRLGVRAALVATWLLGALALVVRALAARIRVRRVARAGFVFAAGGRRDVRLCDGIDSPAVTGAFRATVLLPRAAARWSAERLRIVLLHELAHARSRDALVQLVADAACAVHWFNPLVWIAAARLRVERELAADDAVLAAGVRPSRYAEELLGGGRHARRWRARHGRADHAGGPRRRHPRRSPRPRSTRRARHRHARRGRRCRRCSRRLRITASGSAGRRRQLTGDERRPGCRASLR